METLAAARRAKRRRKPEPPESPEQESVASNWPLPAMGAPDSRPPGAGGEEEDGVDWISSLRDSILGEIISRLPTTQILTSNWPLPVPTTGGEEEDGVDRISSLRDSILGEIISRLPTKDAARTQILATRWRRLWRSAPLNLDGVQLRNINLVSRILSAHRGPGRRFRFAAQVLLDHPTTVDAWLRSPALDNLQEIDCWIHYVWGPEGLRPPPLPGPEELRPPLPASAFRFSSCLCVATLSQCHISDDVARALQFSKLKKLALQRVSISRDSLNSIIVASPVLECLLLSTVFGLHSLKINSASLTSIGVGYADPQRIMVTGVHVDDVLERIKIVDAPCLKRILYHRAPQGSMALQLSVISAPNLETVGCLNYEDYYSSFFAVGSTVIATSYNMAEFWITKREHVTPACAIKILAVNLYIRSLDDIIDFMRCFPCLEKLYIQSFMGGDKNLWRRKHHNLIKCFDIRLKTVVLNNYQGIRSQVNFATFFLLNANMLESMTFQCQRDSVTDRFLAEQHQLLQLEKRASRCARVYFTTKRCDHDFMHINHVHDLSKTDPFECEKSGRCMRII